MWIYEHYSHIFFEKIVDNSGKNAYFWCTFNWVIHNPSLLSRISPFLFKNILYKWKIQNNSCCVTALYAQNIVFYGHFVVGKSPHRQNTTFHVCFFSSADNQYFLHKISGGQELQHFYGKQ